MAHVSVIDIRGLVVAFLKSFYNLFRCLNFFCFIFLKVINFLVKKFSIYIFFSI